jgi:hypothetical protein
MKYNWDLPKQTMFKDWTKPDTADNHGDCWRCCIASVLQVPASEVPDFLGLCLKENGDMHGLTQRWLNARGLFMASSKDFWFTSYETLEIPVIACGPTPRSLRMHQNHAVVMCGGQMVYDPHPSEAGLTAVTDEYLIARFVDIAAPVSNLEALHQ